MKMSMLIAASLLLLTGCQIKPGQSDTVIDGPPMAIIPDHPVWVNASCPTRSIRILTANVPPENVAIRLGGTTIDAEPTKSIQGKTYWNIDIPTDKGYQMLSIVHIGGEEEESLASTPIQYTMPGEDVRIFSQHVEMPLPGATEAPLCWPNYSGTVIPGGNTFTLSYEREQVDRVYASAVRRTIELSDVTLTNNSSGTVYRVEPPLTYTATIPDAVALLDQVSGLGGFDLGSTGRGVQQMSVEGVTLESSEDATPSYRVVKYEYGRELLIRVKGCTAVDTLSSTPFVVPDHLNIELGCQTD